MRSRTWKCFILAAACGMAVGPSLLTAATYTVGGDDADYANLEVLRLVSGLRLANGDVIVFNGNDSSLTTPFVSPALPTWGTITLTGQGVISPNALSSASSVFSYGYAGVKLDGGTLEFQGFSGTGSGGAFSVDNATISGGTNTFSGNSATGSGGAIWARAGMTISGGTNTFTNNTAGGHGGALSNVISIVGGTQTFIGNSASGNGGAIAAGSTLTLRATDGDFLFRGNEDQITNANRKANAISGGPMTFAAEAGRSIYFYDPVTGMASTNAVNINPLATDTGTIVFDGSDYTREIDRYSNVRANTTVGYGTLALKGNVVYGETFIRTSGTSFTLNKDATIDADMTTNTIWAGTITLNGTVRMGLGVDTLGKETHGVLELASNTLTFGPDAVLSVYWDGSLLELMNGSHEYDLLDLFHFITPVNGTSTVSGLGNVTFDVSSFDAYNGLSYTLNGSILTLSPGVVPEPATLAVLGLGLAGLGLARRRR